MNPLRYWLRLAKLFIHYRKKSTILPYFPVRTWVELTSLCNYRCLMCPNKDLKEEDKGFMEFDLYKKIIDEAQNFAFDINLAHRGESFLHPQLIEMIDYAKKKKLFVRLHTNGSLLTEEASYRIIQSGLDRLSFSLDGFDKETYERIRKGGNFEKTIANILRFLETKKEVQVKKPEVVVEVIDFVHKENKNLASAKNEFFSVFKNQPLNGLVIKKLHNWAGEIKKIENESLYSICPFPWNALVIYWNGKVLPCPQDFFGYYVLGNVEDSTLRDIWNNQKMTTLRERLAHRQIDDLETCSDCDRLKRKGFFGVPREYLWRFVTHRMP